MATVLSIYYIIAGYEKGSTERKYWEIDSHSGGWPFWSTFGGKQFSSLEEAAKVKAREAGDGSIMRERMSSIEILKVSEIAEVISTEQIVSEARQKAEEEIAKIRRELEEKVAALEKIS